MPTVKGSKQIRMVAVPYRPWHGFLVRCAVLFCMTVGLFGAYRFGFERGVSLDGDAQVERDLLLEELQGYIREMDSLRQQLVSAEQAHAVDRQSLDAVQLTILNLREKITQLEEDVLFYKQIMSPENAESGLVIGRVDLFSTEDANRFRYRFELKQVGNNDNFVNGYANVDIVGFEGGHERSLPLREVSTSEGQLDIKLQYRYFQNIEGELILPQAFVPDKIQIVAVSQGAGAKTVQKSFGWLVQDE